MKKLPHLISYKTKSVPFASLWCCMKSTSCFMIFSTVKGNQLDLLCKVKISFENCCHQNILSNWG
jgi:hypothetical protein